MSMRSPTHPGAGIQDDLEELGWTVTEAAIGGWVFAVRISRW